jgi:hypothetical protein
MIINKKLTSSLSVIILLLISFAAVFEFGNLYDNKVKDQIESGYLGKFISYGDFRN